MVGKSAYSFTGAIAILTVFVSPTVANALEAATSASPAPVVSCLIEPAKLPDEAIDNFLTSPMAILTDGGSGGATNAVVLSSRVRALAASSSATLDKLLVLVGSASDAQVAAIGAGLSRAALTCVSGNAEYADLIQSKVAGINNSTFLAAFSGAANDIQTAALASGGAAAAGPGAGAPGIGGEGVAGGGTAGLGEGGGVAQTVGDRLSFSRSDNYYATDNSLSPSSP